MGVKDLTSTHTYAELEVSKAAYMEIGQKLRNADYEHAFMSDGTIDMHGIGLTCEKDDVDQQARDAAGAVLKVCADLAHAPYAQVKANIQTIIADALRKAK